MQNVDPDSSANWKRIYAYLLYRKGPVARYRVTTFDLQPKYTEEIRRNLSMKKDD